MSAPPPPSGPEAKRQSHTRMRRRMLYGQWELDLQQRMQEQVGSVRKEAWGRPDMSANVLRSLAIQFATLYDESPEVHNPTLVDDTTQRSVLTDLLTDAGLWSLMQRIQRDTIGMREMVVRVEVSDKGKLVFRPAYPDLIEATVDVDDATRLVYYAELRPRTLPNGEHRWLWDVFDIRGNKPSFRILDSEGGRPDKTKDHSRIAGGAKVGASYVWRFEDGTPYIPAAIYHAQTTGCLWDPYEWYEIVEATLNVGVLWSFWAHTVRDASWPQRYASGVVPQGQTTVGHQEGTVRHEIVTDPSTVLLLDQNEEFEGQPLIGQWQAGGDPKELAEAIAAYERRVIAFVGLAPSDIHRVSGDPRSGYALAITRDAQREHQKRLKPTFARADRDLLRKAVATWNTWARSASRPELAEQGWRTRYPTLPLRPEERRALLEEVQSLLDLGFIDRVEALIRLLDSGMTRIEAERHLAAVQRATQTEEPDTGATDGRPDGDDGDDDAAE